MLCRCSTNCKTVAIECHAKLNIMVINQRYPIYVFWYHFFNFVFINLLISFKVSKYLISHSALKFHIVYSCIVFIKVLLNYLILDYWPVLNVFLVKITSSVVLTSSPLLYTEPFGKCKWFFWSINKYLIIVVREDVFRQLYIYFLFLCVAMLWYSGDKVFICASLSMR